MMHMLRKAAAFILFAILIGAFAISMGGNNYFDRYSHQTVAKVGSEDITPEQFRRAYQRVIENLSNSTAELNSRPRNKWKVWNCCMGALT